MANSLPTFWSWFLYGTGKKPGYRRVLNRWIVLHVGIGIVGASCIGIGLSDVAQAVLLPLMAIFVGLTFSWAGNAHSLLQSSEVVAFSKGKDGGIAEYIFTFQLSILVILVSALAWIIPSLSLQFALGSFLSVNQFNFLAEVLLYALVSLSFRTSWQAVLGANMLLLVRATRVAESQDQKR